MRRLLAILALVAALPAGARSGEAPLVAPKPHPVVQKHLSLRLGRSWKAAGSVLARGHATFLLQQGELTEILAGDRVVGLYFRGAGVLDYLAADRLEHAVLNHNLVKNSSLRAKVLDEGLSLVETVKEAAFWFHGGSDLPAAPAEGAGPASPATLDAWGFFLEAFGHKPEFGLALSLAWRELEGSRQPWLQVQVQGAHERLVYIHDPEVSAQESLALRTAGGEVSVSVQALGWDRRSPLASILNLTRVELDLDARNDERATLTAVETLVPARNSRTLVLALVGPILDRPGGKFLGGAVSVQDEAGRELPFDHRQGRILVELKEPCVAGRPLKLRFHLEGDLLFRPTQATYWKLGVFPWFPQPDLAGQAYTVRASVRVRKPYVPLVPGTPVRRVDEGGETLLETRIDRPVQFFVMDAGRFDLHRDVQGDRTVTVATFGGARGNTEKLGRMAHQYIQLYELLLGPFPFKEFNIIHQREYGYGQAPPGTMYITDEAFDTISSTANQAFSKGVNHRFAHEIAHQYWGHVVKMASGEEQWITESFAEYCSALAILRTKGFGEAKYEAMVAGWRERAVAASPSSSIPEANRLRHASRPMDTAQARQALIYDKGALLLHRLHKEMGDKVFFSMLQTLLRSFDGTFATTLDVQDLAGILAKKDYKPLFERCFWGTEMP